MKTPGFKYYSSRTIVLLLKGDAHEAISHIPRNEACKALKVENAVKCTYVDEKKENDLLTITYKCKCIEPPHARTNHKPYAHPASRTSLLRPSCTPRRGRGGQHLPLQKCVPRTSSRDLSCKPYSARKGILV